MMMMLMLIMMTTMVIKMFIITIICVISLSVTGQLVTLPTCHTANSPQSSRRTSGQLACLKDDLPYITEEVNSISMMNGV